MESISNMLQAFIERRELTLAQFVKRCSIERPTLYQYVSGKRPLNNREHLEQIEDALQCTPSERESLWEAWQVQQVGQSKYNRRKKIAELIASLPSITLPALPPVDLWGRAPLPEFNQVFRDEQAVARTAYSMIREAHRTGSKLDIILQPEEESLLHAVFLFHNSENAARIRHIVCLDSDVQSGTVKNIRRAQLIMKYGAAARSYTPVCYYGHADEVFGTTAGFPGLILTDSAAMQISSDGKSALYYIQPDEVLLFQDRFEKVLTQCRPLMDCSQNMIEALQDKKNLGHISNITWENSLMLCDLCDTIFWTEEFVRSYLHHSLPNREEVIVSVLEEVNKLRQLKWGKQTTLIMNPRAVRTYLQTGIAMKYPPYLQDHPFSVADRRMLVREVLKACREGWYHLRFYDSDHYPLADQWEVAVAPGSSLTLQHITDSTTSYYTFTEPGIVRAAGEYFEMLLSSDFIMSEEDSAALLQQWVDALPPE